MGPEEPSSASGESIPNEDLMSILAHDLRNPLANIQGYSALLLQSEGDSAHRREVLERILSSSRFAVQLIEGILDASEAQRGRLSIEPAPIDLPDVLLKALEAMRHQASRRGATVIFDGPAPDELVLADSDRILQVVQNLIGNALKHVEPGRGRVEVRVHDGGGEVAVEVADNGSGIESRHLERIFEKFFRADGAGLGGLGLGLFIVRQIVQAHGGQVWAQSEGLGRGARFYFTLPKFDPERPCRDEFTSGTTTPPRLLEAMPFKRRTPRSMIPLTILIGLTAVFLFAAKAPHGFGDRPHESASWYAAVGGR